MSQSEVETRLVSEMRNVGVEMSPDVLSKCVALLKNYNLTPGDMATTWETHSLNNNVDDLTEHTFKSFRTTLSSRKSTPSSTFCNSNVVVSPSNTPMKRGAVICRPTMGKRYNPNNDDIQATSSRTVKRKVEFDSQLDQIVSNGGGVDSPLAKSSFDSIIVTPSKASASTQASSKPTYDQNNLYGNRKNAGEVMKVFNPNNLDPITTSSSVEIIQPFGSIEPYKFMSDKDRGNALNSQMTSFEAKICDQILENMNDEEKKELEAQGESLMEFVGVPRQATQLNIGRICNEAHEGKMNNTTILLEGNRHGSNGSRMTLDVSKMEKSFSLFPGQIVGVRGVNSTGRKMVVEEIIDGIETQVVKSMKDDLKRIYETKNGNGAKVFVVCGPYTTNQNLKYEPLADLLSLIVHEKPAAVIMTGPFVDLRQQQLKDGDQVVLDLDGEVHVSYETLFAAKISQELECLYEEFPDLQTKFVLVPSLDDAVSEPVFPQPPIEDTIPDGGKVINEIPETTEIPFGSLCLDNIETAGKRKIPKEMSERRVHVVSNPSTIKINEVTFGVTSTDALLHLSTEEINQKLPPGTRICRLAEHFVRQQSFYPLFPAPTATGMRVNLDINKRSEYAMNVQPDVLILPSKLTCLVDGISDETIVLNPGYLVKGATGGSYAVIDIHPMKVDKLTESEDDEIAIALKDRIRVEIRKI